MRGETNNLKPQRNFQKNIFDCSFSINLDIIKEFNDDKITKKKLLEDLVREQYLKYNNVCILCFYCVTHVKDNTFLYAYCRFNDCTTFRFEITPNGTVVVYRTKDLKHADNEVHVGQIRGVKRSVMKSKLKNKNAYLFRKQQILNAADDIAEKGNFQGIHKLEALRKVKSEGNFNFYYHPDPFFSLILMRRGPYKSYIHMVATPFAVYTWEKFTFETISNNKKILEDSKFTLHLDASGESVRHLESAEKRILTYKLVLRNCRLKKIIPIAEAILSRHTRDAITSFLDALKLFLKENKVKYQFKWYFCKRVCTDVSAALYGAVLKSFNNQTLLEYLNACASFLNNLKVNPNSKPKFVILQWCKCHYIHIMCKDLNTKLGKNHILRPLLKNALIAAFSLTTIEECQQWFKYIFIVLLTPYKSPNFERSLKILHDCSTEFDDENKDKEYHLPDDDHIDPLESISSNSPFRKMFLSIYCEIENDVKVINKGHILNEYRNDDMCIFILNKYCSFIVMWTNIMGIHVDPTGEHISNAPVEFSYFLQKHIILQEKSVRADVFVKIMRIDYLSSLKELRYNYNMFGSVSEEIEVILTSSVNDLNEEVNNKRLKKEHSYTTSTPIDKKGLSDEVDKKHHSYTCLTPMDKKDLSVEIINKEHCYSISPLNIEPVEEWNKKNVKKQKLIKPKIMLESKALKKFTGKKINKSKSVKPVANPLLMDESKVKFFLFKLDLLFYEVNNIYSPIEAGFYDYLEDSDWNSLNDGNWLTNFTVNACLLLILKENKTSNCYCMPCQSKKINVDTFNIFIKNKPNLLFVPILISDHFTLCVLNFSTHEFMHVNSFSSQNVGKNVYKTFINELGTSKNLWKHKEITERKTQLDGSNCGIFVLMYALKILQNQSLTNLSEAKDFRKEMKILLLKYQGDRTRFCCHCGCLKLDKKDVYVCKDCSFYVCRHCTHKHCRINSNVCKIIEQNKLSL